jgi:hypothetical protein
VDEVHKPWTMGGFGPPWTQDRGTAAAHRSSTGRAIRLAGGHREGWGREREEGVMVSGVPSLEKGRPRNRPAVRRCCGILWSSMRRRFGHGEEKLLVGMDAAWSGGAHGAFI